LIGGRFLRLGGLVEAVYSEVDFFYVRSQGESMDKWSRRWLSGWRGRKDLELQDMVGWMRRTL
jgi:hypothetical protein